MSSEAETAPGGEKNRRVRLTRQQREVMRRSGATKQLRRGIKKRGGGYVSWIEPPQEYRGTTNQTCGYFPFVAPGLNPNIGIPLGPRLEEGSTEASDRSGTICCDVVSWFKAGIILNPSSFTFGLPALGKSTLGRRQVLGMSAAGVIPLVLGDLKPDYVDLVGELERGQIIGLGRGRGSCNVLDLGAQGQAANRLELRGYIQEAAKLHEEGIARCVALITGLAELVRKGPLVDHETSVLAESVRVLLDRHKGGEAPLLRHLDAMLNSDNPPESVRVLTLDRGDIKEFRHVVDPLLRTIRALINGPLGDVFARPTSTRIDLDASAVCMDVSSMHGKDPALEAAILLATWAEGFSTVEAANALSDAGLEPQRNFYIKLDELWRTMRSATNMTERIDGVTRLNRNEGVSQGLISHSMADLRALSTESEKEKARGFVERAGLKILFGLPPQELDDINEVVPLSNAEKKMIVSWGSPESLSGETKGPPPGQGCFLLKVGEGPGLPVKLRLTEAEMKTQIHNTNKRWRDPLESDTATIIDLNTTLRLRTDREIAASLPPAPRPLTLNDDARTSPLLLDLREPAPSSESSPVMAEQSPEPVNSFSLPATLITEPSQALPPAPVALVDDDGVGLQLPPQHSPGEADALPPPPKPYTGDGKLAS